MIEYFFASSNYPIFLGLYFRSKGLNVHFLYTRESYKDLFDLLQIPATYIAYPKFTKIVLESKAVKNRLTSIANLTKGHKIHFTHIQFSHYLFAILSNRSETDESVYYNIEPIANNPFTLTDVFNYSKSFLKSFILQKSLLYIYNTHVEITFYSKSFHLALDRGSFGKCGILEYSLEESFEELQIKVLPSVQLNFPKVDKLYFAQNEYKDKDVIYSESSIKKLYNFLESNSFAVKPHPLGYPHPRSEIVLPSHIPSEFFFNSINQVIASINSTTLISASHYYFSTKNDKVKIICLMNLVQQLDAKTAEDMIKRIKERGRNNILFPETYSDLKSYMS